MDGNELEAVSEFLAETDGISTAKIPDSLESHDELFSQIDAPEKCPKCSGDIVSPTEIGGDKKLVCEGSCPPQPMPEQGPYKFSPRALLEEMCDILGYDSSIQAFHEENLPHYSSVEVGDDLQVSVICDTFQAEDSIESLFSDAIRQSRVNAILIPKAIEGKVYDLTAEYPVGSFTPAFPLPMLENPEPITSVIEQARDQRRRSEATLSKSEIEDEGFFRTVERNPSYILTELTYTRIRRESSTSYKLGNHFEKVCEAALKSLNISTKGLGDSGENVADLAFIFPENPNRRNGEEIFGIVDTKSNSEKNLSDEAIADKHRDYIWQGASKLTGGDRHVAHVFIVFEMEGRAANEINWYQLIEEEYSEAPIDGTMVVLYADALARMVAMSQSPVQTNELNLSIDSNLEVYRPFFHFREFRQNVDRDIQTITRVDMGEEPELNQSDQDYIDQYKQCERLIVVTRDMVEQRYWNLCDVKGDDEVALDRYPDQQY